MKTPPKWGDEKPCKDLLDAFEIGDFSRMKREQYDKDMYDEKRRNEELAAARNDGRAEGHSVYGPGQRSYRSYSLLRQETLC